MEVKELETAKLLLSMGGPKFAEESTLTSRNFLGPRDAQTSGAKTFWQFQSHYLKAYVINSGRH